MQTAYVVRGARNNGGIGRFGVDRYDDRGGGDDVTGGIRCGQRKTVGAFAKGLIGWHAMAPGACSVDKNNHHLQAIIIQRHQRAGFTGP